MEEIGYVLSGMVQTLFRCWMIISTVNVRTATYAKRDESNDVIRRRWKFALRYCTAGLNLPDG